MYPKNSSNQSHGSWKFGCCSALEMDFPFLCAGGRHGEGTRLQNES